MDRLKNNHDLLTELQAEIKRTELMFQIRDTKIDHNFEMFLQYKEAINTQMNDFFFNTQSSVERFDKRLKEQQSFFDNIDSFQANIKMGMDHFSHKLAEVEYQAEKDRVTWIDYIENDFIKVKSQMTKLEETQRMSGLQFNDVYQ